MKNKKPTKYLYVCPFRALTGPAEWPHEMGSSRCRVDDSLARITVGKRERVSATAHAHIGRNVG